jgi:hypothetical protein
LPSPYPNCPQPALEYAPNGISRENRCYRRAVLIFHLEAEEKALNIRQGTAVNKEHMVRKTVLGVWLVALALAPFRLAAAQQVKKIQRIGYLTANSSPQNCLGSMHSGRATRTRPYVEGQNIAIEYRHAEGNFDRLPGFAAELVGLEGHQIARPSRGAANEV